MLTNIILFFGIELKLPIDPPLKESDRPRVRIRGIFTTSLSKFFIENNYKIVQPSEIIKERLSLERNPLSPHIDIQTLPRKKGIRVSCLSTFAGKFKELILSEFKDSIIREKEAEKGAVYKGILHRPSPKGGFIVRLTPNVEGWLPPREVRRGRLEKGDIIVVEVKDPNSKVGLPRLSKDINHPGDFAILLPNTGAIKVSHKLSEEEQERLSGLGEVLQPEDWGIIWRTGAKQVGIEKLKHEIDRLSEKAKEFKKAIEKAPSLTKVRKGFLSLDVVFPSMSKKKLDEVRQKVIPTVEKHHQFKALGEKYALLIDFAENKLINSSKLNQTSEEVNTFLFEKFRLEGRQLPIFHRKITGREIILGPAKIIESKKTDKSWEYRTFRRFESGGIYDGIEARQESGDIGVTLIQIDSNKLITLYFDVNEELKGIYVNINTPIELYKNGVGYYDLEIDTVLTKEGKIKIINRKRLENLHEKGLISKSLVNHADNKAKKYKSWLKSGADELIDKAHRVIRLAE